MHQPDVFILLTAPENSQLSESKQQVDDFVVELTFWNHFNWYILWGESRRGLACRSSSPRSSSLTMHYSNGFRKSSPPQNRQLIVLISNSKQLVDDVTGGVDSLESFDWYILSVQLKGQSRFHLSRCFGLNGFGVGATRFRHALCPYPPNPKLLVLDPTSQTPNTKFNACPLVQPTVYTQPTLTIRPMRHSLQIFGLHQDKGLLEVEAAVLVGSGKANPTARFHLSGWFWSDEVDRRVP